jgi:hypothetical protein
MACSGRPCRQRVRESSGHVGERGTLGYTLESPFERVRSVALRLHHEPVARSDAGVPGGVRLCALTSGIGFDSSET